VTGVPVAKVAGIEVRLHPTFLLLLALVLLPGDAEGPGPVARVSWLAAVFASVVVHELAHSLVARRRGMRVRGITLLPIGGVSEIDELPEHPRDELFVAAAGPLTNLGLAGILWLVTAAGGGSVWPPGLAVGSPTARLAWLNLVLGLFNLLPAFPMDGGRVLRAWLARRTDLATATMRAAAAGRTLAVAMAVAGVLWNPWLVLIAAFVYLGATAEQGATLVHVRLQGLHVSDALVTDITAIPGEIPVGDLRAVLRHAAQREVPIIGVDGTFVGMVDGLEVARYGHDDAPISTYADRSSLTVASTDDLETAAAELARRRARSAAVTDRSGRVVGVLRLDDVQRLLAARTGMAAEDAAVHIKEAS
jgi:Zn-dependent protease